jgi:hypothetical protein
MYWSAFEPRLHQIQIITAFSTYECWRFVRRELPGRCTGNRRIMLVGARVRSAINNNQGLMCAAAPVSDPAKPRAAPSLPSRSTTRRLA